MSLGRISHIGIVVDDLAEAIRFLDEVFGLTGGTIVEVPERSVRASFVPWGDLQLELIEPTDRETRSKRLGDASARIDHIAVQVDDVGAAFDLLRTMGVEAQEERPQARGPGVPGLTFFTRPESSDGVVYQFIDVP